MGGWKTFSFHFCHHYPIDVPVARSDERKLPYFNLGGEEMGRGGGRKSVFTLLFIEPRMCSIFYESFFFLLFPRDTLKEIERSFDLTKCVFGVLLFRVHTWNGGR